MVDCVGLENRCVGNGTVGSNPSLSAIIIRGWPCFLLVIVFTTLDNRYTLLKLSFPALAPMTAPSPVVTPGNNVTPTLTRALSDLEA